LQSGDHHSSLTQTAQQGTGAGKHTAGEAGPQRAQRACGDSACATAVLKYRRLAGAHDRKSTRPARLRRDSEAALDYLSGQVGGVELRELLAHAESMETDQPELDSGT
jgi:hypothetical protein